VGEEFQNDNLDLDRDINIQFLRNQKVNARITTGEDEDEDMDSASHMKSRSPLALLTSGWRFLISRLFKINNVLLDYQGVTPLIYQAFLLIEFLQMLFYVFYLVDLMNEFARTPAQQDTR
jgi:hypothetical protein